MNRFSKYIIALICVAVIIFRIIYPELNFDLISLALLAIATLALLIHKPEKIFGRTKKIKFGSFELELQELNKEIEEIEEKIAAKKDQPVGLSGPRTNTTDKSNFNDIPLDPLSISIEIGNVLTSIFNKSVEANENRPLSLIKMIDKLYRDKIIDAETAHMIKNFWFIRNNIIHNPTIHLDEKEYLSISDSGIRILNILVAIDKNIQDENQELPHYGLE